MFDMEIQEDLSTEAVTELMENYRMDIIIWKKYMNPTFTMASLDEYEKL